MQCQHKGCTVSDLEDLLDFCDEHYELHCMMCGLENPDWQGDEPNVCTECRVAQAENYMDDEEDSKWNI